MKCVFCDCTDHQACEGGCSWALPEVCSACVYWRSATGAVWRVMAVAEGCVMLHHAVAGPAIARVDHMRSEAFGWRRSQ